MDKLKLIRIGDEVTFLLNNVKCRGVVNGWRLDMHTERDHRVIVGSGTYEHEIPLHRIVSRSRDKGVDAGELVFTQDAIMAS